MRHKPGVISRVLLAFVALILNARGDAIFGGEIQRFRVTESEPTTVIKLTSAIPAGSVGILDLGVEAPASMKVASVGDSKGNVWTRRASVVNCTVHQVHIISGFIKTALVPGDTITISFEGARNTSRSGSLQFLSGCADDKPEVTLETRSYGMDTKARLETPLPGMILVGALQVDYRNDPSYTPQSWKQIGEPDHFGQTARTVGLQNTYLYKLAPKAGINDLDGAYNSKESWSFVAVGFRPESKAERKQLVPKK